jgi:hypothetical protein
MLHRSDSVADAIGRGKKKWRDAKATAHEKAPERLK